MYSTRLSAFESVPANILVPPARHDVCHVDRALDAGEADHHLVRLARREALCRLLLGKLAGSLLRGKGYHALGFARVSDYTRERLGLSARELQSTAQVAGALETLAGVAAAFASGQLSWTQVRLLTRIATPASEEHWLAAARGRTTRALDAMIRQALDAEEPAYPEGASADGVASGTRAADAGVRPPAAGDEDDEHLIDGEFPVRFRLRCPRRVRVLWRRVAELARRMAGEQLAGWQAAEAVAAEGMAAAGSRAKDAPDERRWQASSVAFVPAWRGVEGRAPDDPNESRAPGAAPASPAAAERLPADLTRLVQNLHDVDAHALDGRLRTVVRELQSIDWQLGRVLRVVFDLRLYHRCGYTSRARYVRERLGISIRKAEALVHVERRAWQAPAFAAAYERGALSWVRALTLLPILSEEQAGAWVARATAVTVRRLAAEVEWALDVRDTTRPDAPIAPPPLGATLVPPQAQMRAPSGGEWLDAEIELIGPASVMALLREAGAAFAVPPEPFWRTFERLLEHVAIEWNSQPRHRDPVFARDGWRCAVPACSSRRNLHDHHVLFRARGGDHARDNRVTVCAWHHLRAIHRGTVRADGRAPDAIRWQLGVRHKGPPLMCLVGERYSS